MTTRWLDAEELAAWMRLVAVVERLPGVLDSQLRRDAGLTHFEYFVLAVLSETPERRPLRMTALAARTNATLPRLSHVISRMEDRDLVRRRRSPRDRRAADVELTETGWATIVAAAPGHVETVRSAVVDALSPEQIRQLREIAGAILARLDPECDGPLGLSPQPAAEPAGPVEPAAGSAGPAGPAGPAEPVAEPVAEPDA